MAVGPRSHDVGWQYGRSVGGRKDHVQCNYCDVVFRGGITRFKEHFVRKGGRTGPCASAPEEVREMILSEAERKRSSCAASGKLDACNKRTRKIMTRLATTECTASKEGTRKRKGVDSKQQKQRRSLKEDTLQSFYNSCLSGYTQAKKLRGLRERNKNSKEQKKLDTNAFESFLEYLWSNLSDVKRKTCTYLDCLWFSLYMKGSSKSKVLTWIKNKHIFSRKYVFVPIIRWRHWSLLILCHFGESCLSKAKRPCMLLLDSLENINPTRLEPDIRRFVLDIYKSEGREDDKSILKIPLLVPKVPQQRDGEKCGIFVLYFIRLFLRDAPEAFNQEGYPYFLTENWFSWEDMEQFHKEVLHFATTSPILID